MDERISNVVLGLQSVTAELDDIITHATPDQDGKIDNVVLTAREIRRRLDPCLGRLQRITAAIS